MSGPVNVAAETEAADTKEFHMNSLILISALFVQTQATPQGQQNPQGIQNQQNQNREAVTPKIEGSWTVVSYEKDGQPMAEAKNCTVTIKDNMITFEGKEGKAPKAMRLEFANMGKLRATEIENVSDRPDATKAKDGVFVCTQDFLAVCVHDTDATNRNPNAANNGTPTKSKCTVVLQRANR